MPRVVIAGCGFLGEAAADLFSGSGWDVLGICRTEQSADRLRRKPWTVRTADLASDLLIDSRWRGADVLVYCASSGGGGVEAYRAIYLEGLLNALNAFDARTLLFTGSTSVYAQTDGSWVDEQSPAMPERETGSVLLEAERLTLSHGGLALRLSGLYGPNRSVLLRKFLAGEARMENFGRRWINQIHRDDAARAIFHLACGRASPGIYNITDDCPATQRDVYLWMARHFRRPLPPPGPPDPSRKRGVTSKRVSNAKLRATSWEPVFPSFKSALPALQSDAGKS